MKEGIHRQVEGYLDEVGLYSKEHRDYLDKLNRVLEEMKQSESSAERQSYNSFKETITSFERYLTDKKIELTRHERERFAIIASSGLGSLAKKRMAEDLMRTVKERHSSESGMKTEDDRRKKEIAALSRSHLFFVNWYRLLLFALDYGTITPFTHLYRASALDVLRVNFVTWFRKIEGELFSILDDYYYYLSTSEYNTLVKLAEAGTAAERFNELKKQASYNPGELFDLMEDFTARYICVIRNTSAIDRALKKVYKERQSPHGFMGHIGSLTDRPLQNNMVVRMTGGSMMRNSVCGVLYSFYTAHFGVRVTTFNQLVYLSGEEGLVDETTKHLTQGAVRKLSEEDKKRESNDFRIKSRIDELEPLVTRYAEMGVSVAEKIFNLDKSAGSLAYRDQYRPLYRLVKIVEGYIKYILDPVASGSGLTVEYEDKKTDDLFSRYPELVKAASEFVGLGEDLQGSRGRDIAGFRVPPSEEGASLVQVLADNDRELPRVEGARLMREILSVISSRAYNLVTRFNEIIIKFNSEGRSEPPDYMDRYDFAVNSRIRHPKIRTLETVLSKKELSVMDLFEAGCAVALYISGFFAHKGIQAIRTEVDRLKSEMNLNGPVNEPAEAVPVTEAANDNIADEVNRTYSDSLTGLRKWEYFEDFILPVYYDDKKCYNGDTQRYVFCCEISNLSEINRMSGNDAGDLVYKKFAAIINEVFSESGIENIILRAPGGVFTGYLTGVTQSVAVDLLHRVLRKTGVITPAAGEPLFGDVLFNAGIYREWKGSEAYKNIEIARKIMIQVADGISGHVGFLRSQDFVVTDKDFERGRLLREGMISVIM